MLEKILSLDEKLFVYLNSLGSETFDGFWLFITRQTNWIPFFLVLFYFIYKKIGKKQLLYLLFFIALMLIFTDQMTNLVKYNFQRLRPCNNPEINSFIRIVQSRSSFSFFSGHASNTMAVATFLYFIFKKDYKHLWILFLWPLVFAYSRIYLGLHYPLDILSGFLFGALSGFAFFKLYRFVQKKKFPI
jgi:undecaprenyl-diphosphatase